MRVSRREVIQGASAVPLVGWHGGISTSVPTNPTIVSATLSSTTFPGGSPDGTPVGTATVSLDIGTFAGSLALTGSGSSNFRLTGTAPNFTLLTNGVVAAGNYSIGLVPTQSGAGNSGSTFGPSGLSPPGALYTITGTGSGVIVATRTYTNTLGVASPSPTPWNCGLNLDRGVLPADSIVTPTVGGVPLATWQMDRITVWDDGSFKFGVPSMLLASQSAGATSQISFVSSVGSWPTTSAITLADMTAGSDVKVEISKLHTTQTLAAGINGNRFLQIGYTQSGGAITGAVLVYNDTSGGGTGNGTYSLVNGSAAGGNPTTRASVTILNNAVTINSGGAGYGYRGTDGSFVAGFNQAVALLGTNGNYNGVRVHQYANGPVCDAWLAIMPALDATTSAVLPHLIVISFVERWKKADGTLLAWRRTCRLHPGTTDTTKALYNYTFDLDFKDGSTVIRGASIASPGYDTLALNQMSGFNTLDSGNEAGGFISTGKMDWSANHAAYCGTILQLTTAEVDSLFPLIPRYLTQFQTGTLVGSALQGGVSITNPPTTRAAFFSKNPANIEDTVLALVQPMAIAGVRAPGGSGGTGHNEGIYAQSLIAWMLALKNGSTTAAQKWLAQARAAAANTCTAANFNALLDKTALTISNTVPTGDAVFAHMPAIPTVDGTSLSISGYTNQFINGGSGGGSITGSLSPYHLPRYALPMYVVEGDMPNLITELFCCGNLMFVPSVNNNLVSLRACSLGATTYSGLWGFNSTLRGWFWGVMTMAGTLSVLPATWADGSASPEQEMLLWATRNMFAFAKAFMSFTGTVTTTLAATPKTIDLSSSGAWDIMKYIDPSRVEITEQIYISYGAHAMPFAAYLLQDHGGGLGAAVGDVKLFCNMLAIQSGAMWGFTGSHFMSDAPLQAQEIPSGSAAITNWSAVDPANPGWPAVPLSIQPITLTSQCSSLTTNTGVQLSCVSGDPTFSVASAGGGGLGPTGLACAMQFLWGTGAGGLNNGGTMYADGSAIWFSTRNIFNSGGTPNVVPPTGFSLGTPYFIHNITPAAGQVQQFTLHATKADGLSGANPITPTSSTGSAIQIWGAPLNTPPADSAGKGSYNGNLSTNGESRIAMTYGFASIYEQYAFNAPGDSTPYPALDANTGITNTMAAAKANARTMCSSMAMPITFADEMVEAFA